MNWDHEGFIALLIVVLIAGVLELSACTPVHHSSDPEWEWPHE